MYWMTMFSLSLTIMFNFTSHPLSMGFFLLIQTLLIALISGNLSINFWYSYIIFIIMIGGMMVLFIYMTSVASNEKFKLSKKIYAILLMSTFSMLSMMIIKLYPSQMIKINDTLPALSFVNINLTMSKYLNFPSILILFFLIIFLLITLIAVAKISNVKYGPLRQKF